MSSELSQSSHRPDYIVVRFADEGVEARARLRWDDEPEICAHVVAHCPMAISCHHAIYSGSEVAAITPALKQIEPRTGTSDVSVGDLAYVYIKASEHVGLDSDFAEVCWFYDPDARPSMFSGPVLVSVFASFEDASDFFAVSRRMRLEGAKRIEIERWN